MANINRTINQIPNSGIDFQVYITVPTAGMSNAPTGKGTLGDLRITDTNAGISVPFWVEDVVSGQVRIWVKIRTNLALGNAPIVINHSEGNTQTWTGDDVFELFEDFNSTDYSTYDEKWIAYLGTSTGATIESFNLQALVDANGLSITGGIANVGLGRLNKYVGIYTNRKFGCGYGMVARAFLANTGQGSHGIGLPASITPSDFADSPDYVLHNHFRSFWQGSVNRYEWRNNGSGQTANASTDFELAWHIFELDVASDNVKHTIDHNVVSNQNVTTPVVDGHATVFGINAWTGESVATNRNNFLDWVGIKKIPSPVRNDENVYVTDEKGLTDISDPVAKILLPQP